MEAVAEVDRGGGKGRFMWRSACEGGGRGRSRQRQIEAAQTQICVEAGVRRRHRGRFSWKPAWSGGCERDWSGGCEWRLRAERDWNGG